MSSRNVGGADRPVRGMLGTVLLTIALGALLAGRRSAGVAVTGSAALLFEITRGRWWTEQAAQYQHLPNK